jgi:mannose-6-phosphate isomerase-like protein (cupin superfamily)
MAAHPVEVNGREAPGGFWNEFQYCVGTLLSRRREPLGKTQANRCRRRPGTDLGAESYQTFALVPCQQDDHNLKGGAMEGYVLRDAPGWTWKANARDNQGRFDFLVIHHLAFGAGPPLHFHATFEDSFFVLDGVLTAQLGDDVVELGPGGFATAPPGVPHSLTNAHADQRACRAVNLLTPGVGFNRYISEIDRLAATGDHEAIGRLNAEYDVTIVGPSLANRLGLS